MKKRSAKLKWIGLTLAGLGAMVSGSAMADGHHAHSVDSHGGLKVFSSSDNSYWFAVGGRLNFDEVIFSGGYQDKGGDFPNGGNLRRALLKFAGGVGESMSYNLTIDFSGANGNRSGNGTTIDFHDAYVNFAGAETGPFGPSNLRFGQFTPATSIDYLANEGTLNDNVFLESALATRAFSLGKAYGLWVDTSVNDMFVLTASAYQPRVMNSTNNGAVVNNNYGDAGRSDRLGGSLRLTFAPVHTDDTTYHLGVVGRYQSMNNKDADGAVTNQTFSTGPEARARNTSALVNAGLIRARSYNVVTGEALAIWGPAFVEGEFNQASVQRVPTITDTATRGNPRFHGWHVEGGYMLTGESRRYDFQTGSLRNPKPASNCGAWEVVARFSYVNLVDKNVYGGSEHNTTLGVNWFVNDNVRLSANYIRANIRQTNAIIAGTAPALNANGKVKRELDIVGLRLGVVF